MYCVKCGVELAPGTESCPLCGTAVYHPEIEETPSAPPYPRYTGADGTVSRGGMLFIITFVSVIPLIVCLIIDLNLTGKVTWSGYAAAGIIASYIVFFLPLWFKKPNPVIFLPTALCALLLLALFVSLRTGGKWFLPFAFPVGAALILILEAATVLSVYAVGTKRHRLLYIIGGVSVAFGLLCVLIEFLIKVAFGIPMTWWSLYPLAALFLIGMMLIIIAICRPLRESLHKKFFI